MKKLKNELREWVFEKLLLFLFKFSETHKLIRFHKSTNDEKIIYEIVIRTLKDNSKEELEKHLSEYFKNVANQNFYPKDSTLKRVHFNVEFFPEYQKEEVTSQFTTKETTSEEIFKIRLEVMNLTAGQWQVVNTKAVQTLQDKDILLTTIRDFYNEMGCTGGMFFSGKCNEEEKRFSKLFYEYGRDKHV